MEEGKKKNSSAGVGVAEVIGVEVVEVVEATHCDLDKMVPDNLKDSAVAAVAVKRTESAVAHGVAEVATGVETA